MIKVVEIINSLDKRGGAEVFFYNLCKELINYNDIELLVVSLYDKPDPSFKEFTNGSIRFESCGKKGKFDLSAAKKLKRIIETFNPDIINSHLSIFITYFFAFGLKRHDWRIIHTVHSLANKEASKIDRFIRNLYIKKNLLRFITISKKVDETVRSYYKNPSTYLILNGIKLRDVQQQKKDIYFICPARYNAAKNHMMLLTVMNRFLSEHEECNLYCFGDGDLRIEYQKELDNMENRSKIFLNGQVNDIYPYLEKSKFFILSSIYEGNPISVLEALNCGVPVIAPRIGGIPDVITDKKNGFLFEATNYDDMLEKLNEAYNVNDYDALSNECKESVKPFSIEDVSNNYYKCFKNNLRKNEK